MAKSIRDRGSVVIDASRGQLDVSFLQDDGQVGDRFVIEKPVDGAWTTTVQPGGTTTTKAATSTTPTTPTTCGTCGSLSFLVWLTRWLARLCPRLPLFRCIS